MPDIGSEVASIERENLSDEEKGLQEGPAAPELFSEIGVRTPSTSC